MVYSINNIAMSDFGLYIAKSQGLGVLEELKEQLFTVYSKEGYQIVKRKDNALELDGFFIASSPADFVTKKNNLFTAIDNNLFEVVLDDVTKVITCFFKAGFKIENVRVADGAVYAKLLLKVSIIEEKTVAISRGVFTNVFTSVFGGRSAPIEPPETSSIFTSVFTSVFGGDIPIETPGPLGIFNNAFSNQFN